MLLVTSCSESKFVLTPFYHRHVFVLLQNQNLRQAFPFHYVKNL
jgi:hypothetical protein